MESAPDDSPGAASPLKRCRRLLALETEALRLGESLARLGGERALGGHLERLSGLELCQQRATLAGEPELDGDGALAGGLDPPGRGDHGLACAADRPGDLRGPGAGRIEGRGIA